MTVTGDGSLRSDSSQPGPPVTASGRTLCAITTITFIGASRANHRRTGDKITGVTATR